MLILADDLGYGDLGCYGNQVNRTPHLDRLAREGLRFTDFHANGANCSPTRAALLTGRYQQQAGIEGALGENAPGLRLREITLAERLGSLGYATGMFGKWHLGYFPTNGPSRQGFDRFVGHLHGATDYHSHVDKYGRMDWWHDTEPTVEMGYNTKLITDHSIRFVQDHKSEPFFLLVSHSAIHFPWMTPEDDSYRETGKRYEGAKDKIGPHAGNAIQPVVQRMIEELDASVGSIVQAIHQHQLDEQTLVFFTSDNGGIVRMAGVPMNAENAISSNGPLRGQKHSLYEGGHRVPAIAWWPGKIIPKGELLATTMTMDLYPTLVELASKAQQQGGEPTPAKAAYASDGVSLVQQLLDPHTPLAERTLFWRQGDSRAARWGNWKLVSIHNGPFELFDLAADLAERTNLASTHPEIRQRLERELNQWELSYITAQGN